MWIKVMQGELNEVENVEDSIFFFQKTGNYLFHKRLKDSYERSHMIVSKHKITRGRGTLLLLEAVIIACSVTLRWNL